MAKKKKPCTHPNKRPAKGTGPNETIRHCHEPGDVLWQCPDCENEWFAPSPNQEEDDDPLPPMSSSWLLEQFTGKSRDELEEHAHED